MSTQCFKLYIWQVEGDEESVHHLLALAPTIEDARRQALSLFEGDSEWQAAWEDHIIKEPKVYDGAPMAALYWGGTGEDLLREEQ